MALTRVYDDEEDQDRDQEQRLRPISPIMRERTLNANKEPARLAVAATNQPGHVVISPEDQEEINAGLKTLPAPTIGAPEDRQVGARLEPIGAGAETAGRLPKLSYEQKERLPNLSADVTPGSSEYYANKIAKLEEPKPEPTTRLGKIGHVLGRIGNIAGDILAPGQMALIPGTDVNKALQVRNLGEQQREAEETEQKGGLRKAQELNLISEAETRTGKELTPEQEALAARTRILATPEGEKPNANDVATWNAFADLENAKQSAKGTDEEKQPLGDAGVSGHNKRLETLTQGMQPDEKKKFLDAYGVNAKDTVGVSRKREEDAKAAAALSGTERTRKTEEAFHEREHQDAMTNKEREMSGEVIRAVDKDNKVHLISREEYEANKGNYVSQIKLDKGAIEKATDHATAINEMQARANSFAHAIQNFNWQDSGQKNIVRQALAHSGEPGFIDKMLGVPLTQVMASGLKQWGLEGATEDTMKYIIGALSMREAAMGLPKEITGGSRATEQAIQALWQTLPDSATPDSKWAMEQMKTFQSIVERLKNTRVPSVPGLPSEPVDSLLQEAGPAKKGGAGGGPGRFGEFNAKQKKPE